MPIATLVWFRRDLRLDDNPALQWAAGRQGPVIPIFIHAPQEESPWEPGEASRWWLHQSLAALQTSLRQRGLTLVFRQGPSLLTLQQLIRETGADAVVWNRRYEPAVIRRDQAVKTALKSQGIVVESFNAALLFEPWEIRNKQGLAFQVFTPFWRACMNMPEPPSPRPLPRSLVPLAQTPHSVPLSELGLEPAIDWAGDMRRTWPPGETAALHTLERFLETAARQYDRERHRPDLEGTSRLSPYLSMGLISPRRIWHTLRLGASRERLSGLEHGPEHFLREMGWREFAYHLLYHFPHTTDQPLREEFGRFPWRENASALAAWRKGVTGYPIVDAGMRELWALGWMHNRVRMIAASFLVKDLLIPWQAGARWFWNTLIDADLASNTLGWQWTAGCGADAAPYFRVFNPVLQGEKFDPQGVYVRRWVPELAPLASPWIHQPWQAPVEILRQVELSLGKTYPRPIVDHAWARTQALQALATLRIR